VSGSGISWAICKSAPRSRQITTPAPHHSVFTGRMPFLPVNQQCQSTEGRMQHTMQVTLYCALGQWWRQPLVLKIPVWGKLWGGGNLWKLKFAEFSLLSAFLIASWLHWIDLKHTNCWLAVHHVFNVMLLCKLNFIQKLLESGLTCPELLYSMYMYLQPKLDNLRTNAKRQ